MAHLHFLHFRAATAGRDAGARALSAPRADTTRAEDVAIPRPRADLDRTDQKWVTMPSIGRKLWKSPKVFTSARSRTPARPVRPCRPMSFGPTSMPIP